MSVAAPVKKSAPVKKADPKKVAPVKKAPTKVAKSSAKAAAPKSAKAAKSQKPAVPKTGRPGRPPGPLHIPNWIEGAKSTPFSRKNSTVQIAGLGSLYLRANAEGAPALANLAKLVEAKDPRLVKLLK